MKSILVVVPYDNIYPPMNGGMQRCFHIIHQLAKRFDLTTIIHQDKESFEKAAKVFPAIKSITIYSTKDQPQLNDVFSLLPAKSANAFRYRWIKKRIKDPADSNFLQYYPVLKRLLHKNKYDGIILENFNSINAVSIIRKYDKQVKIIYDAHNVDTNLCKDKKNKEAFRKVESALYKTVNALLVCSENDRLDFIKMNKGKLAVGVIPNGVSVGDLYDDGVSQDKLGYIIFCGALWTPPNQEGLLWFYGNIWPAVRKIFPKLKLLVVGSGTAPGSFQAMLKDDSLQFTGPVDDVKPWYNKAALAIVPLLSGSGTRLKILEAMSYGLPVISTSKGAEGIEYSHGQDIIIADKESEFADQVVALLKNKDQRIKIERSGRKLVEAKYDWNIVGEQLQTFLCEP